MKKNRKARQGVVVVELAIALPVLMLLIFGTLEICNMIKLKQSLTVATYESAIITLVPGATTAEVQAAMAQVFLDRGVTGATVTIAPSNFTSAPAGTPVAVSATANLAPNSVVFSGLFGNASTSAKAVFMKDLD